MNCLSNMLCAEVVDNCYSLQALTVLIVGQDFKPRCNARHGWLLANITCSPQSDIVCFDQSYKFDWKQGPVELVTFERSVDIGDLIYLVHPSCRG
jgi:hypothetical protein